MRIPGNFDRWMFNYKEGNLSQEEIEYFESYMLNDSHAEDIEAWDNAYVRNVNFKYDKIALLQKESFMTRWGKWAALLLVLISTSAGLIFFTQQGSDELYSSRIPSHDLKSDELIVSSDWLTENVITELINLKQNQIALQAANATFVSNYSAQVVTNFDSNSTDEYGSFSTDYEEKISINYLYTSKVDYNAIKIEEGKVNNSSSKYSAGFALNPIFDGDKKDINFEKLNWSLILKLKLKRLYRSIEGRTGYPIAVTNFRDPELIIPDRNLLEFNPGFAGSSRVFRIGADYRNQWMGQDLTSQNGTFYFDKYSESLKGGLGGSLKYSDYNYGSFQNYVASLFYSPKFALGKHAIFEPGIKMSMGMMTRNAAKITPDHFIEFDRGRVLETFKPGDVSGAKYMLYKDFGLGFVLNTDWFYLGANVDNIAEHDQTIFTSDENKELQSPKLLTGIIGFDFQSRNKKRMISPFLTYYQYGPKTEAWVGATAQLNWLTIGGSYSSNNEYAGSIGLKFKTFRLNYQVDNLESEFLQKSFVSHNIGVRFNAKNKATR